MARAPGILTELGDAAAEAWTRHLDATLAEISPPARVIEPDDERATEVTVPDWQAFPVRAESCLTRHQAHLLLDWRTANGDEGRVRHQEEYLEWRAVRDGDGRLTRVEMTTELADYWKVLAAFEPERTIALVEELSRGGVDPVAVYGGLDLADATPEDRGRAFAATMLPPPRTRDITELSTHNSGQTAIELL